MKLSDLFTQFVPPVMDAEERGGGGWWQDHPQLPTKIFLTT